MNIMKNKRKITQLIKDENNANKGTERGRLTIKSSLAKYGAGRSVLADKNMKIIAGNQTVEQAKEIGIENIICVPTDGKELVVVVREDLDLETDQTARELAIADNRTNELSLNWDNNKLTEELKSIGNLEPLFTNEEMANLIQKSFPQKTNIEEIPERKKIEYCWYIIGVPIEKVIDVQLSLAAIADIDGVFYEQCEKDVKNR